MTKKLYKKLMVLFLSFTMIVFTAAMIFMMSNAVTKVRNLEAEYVNNITNNIVEDIRSGTQVDARYLETFDCYIKITDGNNSYESPVVYNTASDILIKRFKTQKSILWGSMILDLRTHKESNRTASTVIGEEKDRYYGMHCMFTTDGNTSYDLIILSPQSSAWKIVRTYCNWYPLLWLGTYVLRILASGVLMGKAVQPIESAMQSQKEFIASASHELKTPLAVIQVSAETLDTDKMDATAAQKQKVILEECTLMSNLINSLLALASSDSGSWKMDLRENDVDSLLIETWEVFSESAQKNNIHLDWDVEKHYPKLYCDKERIMQVFGILLDNAIAHAKSNDTIQMGAKAEANYIVFYVKDHGCGIADKDKEKIFDRFYTGDASRTNKNHYGLGLSIAKEIVRLHHGTISLKDTPGGGCTFEIYIPIEKATC